jgi:hypothetical protein
MPPLPPLWLLEGYWYCGRCRCSERLLARADAGCWVLKSAGGGGAVAVAVAEAVAAGAKELWLGVLLLRADAWSGAGASAWASVRAGG